MSLEVMKQAVEALHNLTGWKSEAPQTIWYAAHEAITSLRQAIAEAEAFEHNVCGRCGGIVYDPVVPQPKREWVGLTDEEYLEAESVVWITVKLDNDEKEANKEFYNAIEAKLKEKNNG